MIEPKAATAIPAPPDSIPALAAQLASIEARRASLAQTISEASQEALRLRGEQDAGAAKLAAGAPHSASAAVILAGKVQEAEASLAMVQNAEKILDAERERVSALLLDSQKAQAVQVHRNAIAHAKKLAAAYDAKADELNAAFDAWKAATLAAASSWPPHILQPAWGYQPFPGLGAGIVGARPLHPEILSSISQLNGGLPSTGRVADYG